MVSQCVSKHYIALCRWQYAASMKYMRLEHPFEQYGMAWLIKQELEFSKNVAVIEGGASSWGFECRSYAKTAGKPNGFWIKHLAHRWASTRGPLLSQALHEQCAVPLNDTAALKNFLFSPGVLPTIKVLNATKVAEELWPEWKENPEKLYFKPTINLNVW